MLSKAVRGPNQMDLHTEAGGASPSIHLHMRLLNLAARQALSKYAFDELQ